MNSIYVILINDAKNVKLKTNIHDRVGMSTPAGLFVTSVGINMNWNSKDKVFLKIKIKKITTLEKVKSALTSRKSAKHKILQKIIKKIIKNSTILQNFNF